MTSGLDVLQTGRRGRAPPTAARDGAPKTPVTIQSITVEKK